MCRTEHAIVEIQQQKRSLDEKVSWATRCLWDKERRWWCRPNGGGDGVDPMEAT